MKLNNKWFCDLAKNLMYANLTTIDYENGKTYFPVKNSFKIYFHKSKLDELVNVEGYIPIVFYPKPKLRRKNEIGTIGNFRVFIDEKLQEDMVKIIAKF